MSNLPEPVRKLRDAIDRLPGVKDVEFGLRGLDGFDVRALSLPGEYGDLPAAAIRRTNGGRPGERLVTAEVRFYQNHAGWAAVEFLAWWVRDLSRSGYDVQMRPLALPPVGYGTQLGRTLKFVLEFFFVLDGEDNGPMLDQLGGLADSLDRAVTLYAKVVRRPTKAEWRNWDEVRKCAARGDAQAMIRLGEAHAEGEEEVPQDEAAAFDWFRRAAEAHHPHGVMLLAGCYEYGRGVERDPRKALELYRQAAEAGIEEAEEAATRVSGEVGEE